jgi:hypothetical protein
MVNYYSHGYNLAHGYNYNSHGRQSHQHISKRTTTDIVDVSMLVSTIFHSSNRQLHQLVATLPKILGGACGFEVRTQKNYKAEFFKRRVREFL